MSSPSNEKPPVRVEDLLRLKRVERPNPEFWSQFERELRQKQLTALVQKRRWWDDLSLLIQRRIYLPVGATAIIAFSVVTVRHVVPGRIATPPNLAPTVTVAESAVEMLPAREVSLGSNRPAGPVIAPVGHTEHAVVSTAVMDMTESVGLLPLPAVEHETPSARSIAANLARLEQSEPDLVNAAMGGRLSSVPRPSVAAETAMAMESQDAPQYRLIARYADHSLSPTPVAPVLVRERLARRLGDDMNERISRVGVEGSRVSLKF
jgi:hypothetical protein